MILDTHKEVKKLVDVGMEEKMAEAIVDLRVRSDESRLWREIEEIKYLILQTRR